MRALWMVVLFLAAGPAVAAEAADGGASSSHAEPIRRDAEQMRRDAEQMRHDAEARARELREEQKERAREARDESKERSREERDRERETQQNIDETVRQAMEQAREQVAHAREQMQEAMNQMRELSHEEHGRHGARPKIGVLVRDDGAQQDTKGAYVEAVTPGSPAEKAGIKAGDVLTSLDAKPLIDGHPMAKLIDAIHAAKPGAPAVVNLVRGKSTMAVNVTIPEGQGWSYGIPPLPPIPPIPPVPPMPEVGEIRFSSRHLSEHWRDMDLVALNPDLGEYFGAKEGVLVLKAPADAALPLKAGDVILKVGDRQSNSPSQVVRILRSYEPGETFKVEVLRKKDHQTLTGKMPES